MWLRRSLFLTRVFRGFDLNTEVVHNIVVVGSTTPPRRRFLFLFSFPFFFLFPLSFCFFSPSPFHPSLILFVSLLSSSLWSRPLSLSLSSSLVCSPPLTFRGTLSSIKAEGIDAEMIEHCAPQCSSMYRSVLRVQREYVVYRSNWTMIDDAMSAPPRLLLLSLSPSFTFVSSLYHRHLCLCRFER